MDSYEIICSLLVICYEYVNVKVLCKHCMNIKVGMHFQCPFLHEIVGWYALPVSIFMFARLDFKLTRALALCAGFPVALSFPEP